MLLGTVWLDVKLFFFFFRNCISARWYGFTDPHSGLDYFTWRAGTRPGIDDIVKSTHLPMIDILVNPNLRQKLPIGKRVYVTIKAYNKAGIIVFFKTVSV